MLQDLENITVLSISIDQIIFNSLIALVCGIAVTFIYRATYRGPSYSDAFGHSMILLAMITAVVIMVIGSNLARAFGLVGAMSIIRFRTAVKDTQDIIFIFFALAIGMAAGAGLHLIAISGTILIGIIALLLSRSEIIPRKRREFLLQLSLVSTDDTDAAYLPLLKKYCKRNKLINMRSGGEGAALELSYYINLKDESKSAEFVQEIKKLAGIERINLFFDEQHF